MRVQLVSLLIFHSSSNFSKSRSKEEKETLKSSTGTIRNAYKSTRKTMVVNNPLLSNLLPP